jgi:hypothetical protein
VAARGVIGPSAPTLPSEQTNRDYQSIIGAQQSKLNSEQSIPSAIS